MKLDHLSFQQLHKLQSSTNIMRFLDGEHDRALAICHGATVRRALVRAARRDFPKILSLPRAPMPYAVVYRHQLCGAGEQADRYMVCRASLIRRYCELNGGVYHSLREFDTQDPFRHRVEVWIDGSPTLCRALTYQLGMPSTAFGFICRRMLCDPTVVCPYFSLLKWWERINPANTFSATPDAMDIWKIFCEYAN